MLSARLFASILAGIGLGSSGFGGLRAPLFAGLREPRPARGKRRYSTRSRWTGSTNPAGTKLARKIAKRRLYNAIR